MRTILKTLTSIAIGAALSAYLIWCWAQIAGRGTLLELAIAAGLRGSTLHAVLTPIDFLISVILLLPGAWAILALGKDRAVLHVALATVALIAISISLIGWPQFNLGFWAATATLLAYAALPFSAWLIARISRRAPNNSFKPTPLRGAP